MHKLALTAHKRSRINQSRVTKSHMLVLM